MQAAGGPSDASHASPCHAFDASSEHPSTPSSSKSAKSHSRTPSDVSGLHGRRLHQVFPSTDSASTANGPPAPASCVDVSARSAGIPSKEGRGAPQDPQLRGDSHVGKASHRTFLSTSSASNGNEESAAVSSNNDFEGVAQPPPAPPPSPPPPPDAPATSDSREPNDPVLHKLGQCRPCHYMSRSYGCLTGAECRFCHESHEEVRRPRISKSKRQQVKRVLDKIDFLRDAQPDTYSDVTRVLSEKSQYLSTVLRGREAKLKKFEALRQAGTDHPAAPSSSAAQDDDGGPQGASAARAPERQGDGGPLEATPVPGRRRQVSKLELIAQCYLEGLASDAPAQPCPPGGAPLGKLSL